MGMFAQPFQDTKPAQARHLQVQQEYPWQSRGGDFFKQLLAAQVVNCLDSIANEMDRRFDARFLKSPMQQERVIGIIFCHQRFGERHNASTNWRLYSEFAAKGSTVRRLYHGTSPPGYQELFTGCE